MKAPFFPVPCDCEKKMAAEVVENRCACVILQCRPGVENEPTETNFAVKTMEVPLINEGQFLAKTLYLSVDPYMRCLMNEDSGVGYLTTWDLGKPPSGGGVGTIVKSRCEGFQEGDIVYSFQWPWQEFVAFSGDDAQLSKVTLMAHSILYFTLPFCSLGEGLAVLQKWSICQFLCSSHVYFYYLGSKLLFFIAEPVCKVYY